MNITTTYYRDFNNYHWFTCIGKFKFYSAAKPTARQIRRWKKMTKRVSWLEYEAMINGHYGKFGYSVSTLFIPGYFLTESVPGICNNAIFIGADLANGPDTTATIEFKHGKWSEHKVIGTGRVVEPQFDNELRVTYRAEDNNHA